MHEGNHEHVHKKLVTVFGNETIADDSLAVSLVPRLKSKLSHIEFVVADPTENMAVPKDEWTILDVGMGIEEVVVIEDLKQLDFVKGQSVHDYDVYMDLRLREKIGQLPKLKIILVPYNMKPSEALRSVVELLQ